MAELCDLALNGEMATALRRSRPYKM